ncbi:unnamed protein product, partial [Amoebophrya sp. A120]
LGSFVGLDISVLPSQFYMNWSGYPQDSTDTWELGTVHTGYPNGECWRKEAGVQSSFTFDSTVAGGSMKRSIVPGLQATFATAFGAKIPVLPEDVIVIPQEAEKNYLTAGAHKVTVVLPIDLDADDATLQKKIKEEYAGSEEKYIEQEILGLFKVDDDDALPTAPGYTEVFSSDGKKGLCAQSTITNGNPTHLPDVRGWIDNDPSPHARDTCQALCNKIPQCVGTGSYIFNQNPDGKDNNDRTFCELDLGSFVGLDISVLPSQF